MIYIKRINAFFQKIIFFVKNQNFFQKFTNFWSWKIGFFEKKFFFEISVNLWRTDKMKQKLLRVISLFNQLKSFLTTFWPVVHFLTSQKCFWSLLRCTQLPKSPLFLKKNYKKILKNFSPLKNFPNFFWLFFKKKCPEKKMFLSVKKISKTFSP